MSKSRKSRRAAASRGVDADGVCVCGSWNLVFFYMPPSIAIHILLYNTRIYLIIPIYNCEDVQRQRQAGKQENEQVVVNMNHENDPKCLKSGETI